MFHSKAVATKKGNKGMTTYFLRGSVIWLNYYVDGARKQKSTKLKNTPQNIKIVKDKIIPALDIKIATGEIYKKKPQTFGYYGNIFLEQKKGIKSYSSKLPKWKRVIEFFKNRNIDTITRLDIKEYLNSLKIKSASKATYRSGLNGIFELAVDDAVMNFNPALNIRLSKDVKEAVRFYTKDEVNNIIEASSGFFKVYLQIAFNTGMRTGEILGLQLGDFEDGYISIKRSRTKGIVGSGKTWNAQRRVPYPSFIYDEVRKIQTNNIFIFGNTDDAGKLDYLWRQCVLDAKVKKLRLYCTRHTYATLMLNSKLVSINELAGLLGHSSAKTTLDKYASVLGSESIDLGKDFSLYGDNTVTVYQGEDDKVRKIGL
ncbi:MAG: site-specific integrase [Sulfurimonas sp.]